MQKDYTGWEQIDEEQIISYNQVAIEANCTEDIVQLQRILAAGEAFKEAELTPIYVFDPKTDRIAVYAEELREKPFIIN